MEISQRLRQRIERDFEPGSREEVVRVVTDLSPEALGRQDSERVLAAVVVSSQGEWWRFEDAVATLNMDWRDALVSGGLAHEDWRERLEAALGSNPD